VKAILFVLLAMASDSATDPDLTATITAMQPAVVGIQASMRSPENADEFIPYAEVTGFFFDPDGYIFTVYSPFVDPEPRLLCEKFEVTTGSGQILEAQAWNVFPLVNLAILKVNAENKFPAIPLSGRPRMNPEDLVTALTAGLDQESIFQGVVRARGGNSLYGKGLADLLTDIAMEMPTHAYGAPLINQKGEVVGICLAPPDLPDSVKVEAPAEPEVHALPVLIMTTMEKMKMVYPPFEQPWLGIETRRGGRPGLVVDFVWSDGPAARADVRVGDILRHPQGARMEDPYDLDLLLRKVGSGSALNFRVVREGQEMTKAILIETRARWAAPWVDLGPQP